MIRSMTGFASRMHEDELASVSVTIRGVNHRYLDLQIRLPSHAADLEPRLRAAVQQHVSRGRVEVLVGVQLKQSPAVAVELNEPVIAALADALERARRRGLVQGSLTPGDLIRLPQALSIRERPPEGVSTPPALASIVLTAVTAALGEFEAMRSREGEFLRADLEQRREGLTHLVERLAAAAEEGRGALEARLLERARELARDLEADASALAQEVVRTAGRSDISEELVRLRGHLTHWQALADGPDPCGRKLDFLLQEMNREVNTIGAKIEGTGAPELVIEAKAELEKMREQVQNVE